MKMISLVSVNLRRHFLGYKEQNKPKFTIVTDHFDVNDDKVIILQIQVIIFLILH